MLCEGADAAGLERIPVRLAAGRGAATEQVVESGCNRLCLRILQPINLDPRGRRIRPVETRYPFAGEVDPAAATRYGENGIEPCHGLQLHGILRHSALARVKDVIDLADDGLGGGIGNRENRDGFRLQPVDVDRIRRLDRSLAFGSRALHYHQIGRRVDPYGPGAAAEPFEQVAEVGGGYEFRSDHRRAEAFAGAAVIDIADAAGIGRQNNAIEILILDDHRADRRQGALQERHEPRSGNRLRRREGDLPGNTLVDEIIDLEDVAEDRLADGPHVGIFEIEFVGAGSTRHQLVARSGDMHPCAFARGCRRGGGGLRVDAGEHLRFGLRLPGQVAVVFFCGGGAIVEGKRQVVDRTVRRRPEWAGSLLSTGSDKACGGAYDRKLDARTPTLTGKNFARTALGLAFAETIGQQRQPCGAVKAASAWVASFQTSPLHRGHTSCQPAIAPSVSKDESASLLHIQRLRKRRDCHAIAMLAPTLTTRRPKPTGRSN